MQCLNRRNLGDGGVCSLSEREIRTDVVDSDRDAPVYTYPRSLCVTLRQINEVARGQFAEMSVPTRTV